MAFSIALFAALAPSPVQGQGCEICHYWSVEACLDRCVGADNTCDCCCYRACGSSLPHTCDDGTGAGGGGDDDEQDPFCCSPILVDLGRHGLDLTSAGEGVAFDIDGDGSPEQIAWTRATAADPFLALDRNGNGSIDSGAELFGQFTDQPASPNPNGFLALAVFDQAANGGNGDGAITMADTIWWTLLLWTDSSHDGVSQAAELQPVAASSLSAILLDYKESRRRDRYGNRYTYKSSGLIAGDARRVDLIDVFFAR